MKRAVEVARATTTTGTVYRLVPRDGKPGYVAQKKGLSGRFEPASLPIGQHANSRTRYLVHPTPEQFEAWARDNGHHYSKGA